jgi:hypothetical protein
VPNSSRRSLVTSLRAMTLLEFLLSYNLHGRYTLSQMFLFLQRRKV